MGISWCRISPYRFFDISHALDLRRYKGVEPLGKVGHLSTLWVPGSVGSCVGLESRMWEKKNVVGSCMYVYAWRDMGPFFPWPKIKGFY